VGLVPCRRHRSAAIVARGATMRPAARSGYVRKRRRARQCAYGAPETIRRNQGEFRFEQKKTGGVAGAGDDQRAITVRTKTPRQHRLQPGGRIVFPCAKFFWPAPRADRIRLPLMLVSRASKRPKGEGNRRWRPRVRPGTVLVTGAPHLRASASARCCPGGDLCRARPSAEPGRAPGAPNGNRGAVKYVIRRLMKSATAPTLRGRGRANSVCAEGGTSATADTPSSCSSANPPAHWTLWNSHGGAQLRTLLE